MPKVKVSAKPDRFRRAGMEFTREPVEVDVDNKTLKALQEEPMLAVEVLKEVKEKDPKDPASKNTGGKNSRKDPKDPGDDSDTKTGGQE